jgi:hypothetical protein
MKNFILSIVALTFAVSACALPSLTSPAIEPSPVVDAQATIDSVVQTSEAQTLAAQPTATVAPVIVTETATRESTATVITDTSTPAPNLTTTPATATLGALDLTVAPTATATSSLGSITVTPTLGILKYGTLPPAVPWGRITLINKSRAQAYISLQNYPPTDKVAILEYPVEKQVEVEAPLGYYFYVVWVGGRQITGSFKLHKNEELTITIYKDKVEIKQGN